MKSKLQKKQEAVARAEQYKDLTPKEKVTKLDQKLGVGIGASKQRRKLMAMIDASETPIDEESLKIVERKRAQKQKKENRK